MLHRSCIIECNEIITSDREKSTILEARIPVEDDDHLRPIVERVTHGESLVITQNGTPVARVISIPGFADIDARNAVGEMLAFRKGRSLGGLSIKELINKGRP